MDRPTTRFAMTWLVILGFCAAGAADSARGEFSKKVEDSMGRAEQFINSQQQKDGTWEEAGQPRSVVTATAVMALLDAGESDQQPRIKPAIEFLKQATLDEPLMVARHLPLLRFLERGNRGRETSIKQLAYVSALYGNREQPWPTTQRTQMDVPTSAELLLSLRDDVAACTPTPQHIKWRKNMRQAWLAGQNADGGWGDFLGKTLTIEGTLAGIAAVLELQDTLLILGAEGDILEDQKSLDRAYRWLGDGGRLREIRSCRALYLLSRAGCASGRKRFGEVDWYGEMARRLVETQHQDGSWGENPASPLVNTCLGLTFLARSREPIALCKLRWGDDRPGEAPPWNRRSQDAANLAAWMGRQLCHNFFGWQAVSLKQVDDLHDGTILYISGKDALRFSPEEDATLRRYLEDGGIIVGNVEEAGATFAESFKALGIRLYPGRSFRPLPDDHPICKHIVARRRFLKRVPNVLALGNDSRLLMLLFDRDDPGLLWHHGRFDRAKRQRGN